MTSTLLVNVCFVDISFAQASVKVYLKQFIHAILGLFEFILKNDVFLDISMPLFHISARRDRTFKSSHCH